MVAVFELVIPITLSKTLSLSLQFVGLQKEQVLDVGISSWPPQVRTIYNEIETSEFANNKAFIIKVYYGTEATSKTKSDITQLVNYDEKDGINKTSIKKVKVDNLSEYPLTYTQMANEVKRQNSKITNTIINEIVSKNKIKQNSEYAFINFRNKKQENDYKKNKKIPSSTPIIYKKDTVYYIVSLYNDI